MFTLLRKSGEKRKNRPSPKWLGDVWLSIESALLIILWILPITLWKNSDSLCMPMIWQPLKGRKS